MVSTLLLLVGFALSALYWTLVEAPAFLAKQENYSVAIAAASDTAQGTTVQPSPEASANDHWIQVQRAARVVEAHGHFLFICILLVLFAPLIPGTRTSAGPVRLLPGLAGSGIIIYPTGLILQGKGYILAGQILAAGGALMIIAFAGSIVWGLWQQTGREDHVG